MTEARLPPEVTARASNPEEGLLTKQVALPVGIWNDVLELGRTSGLDYRDALVELVDLGVQAQSEGLLKPRLLSIDHVVWSKVAGVKQEGESDDQALLRLVDLGAQVKTARLNGQAPPPREPDGIKVLVTLFNEKKNEDVSRLGVLYCTQVPSPGDVFTMKATARALTVLHRSWIFTGERQIAFLRVKEVK